MEPNDSQSAWLNLHHLNAQEQEVKLITEKRFGKNNDGFCDFALKGIELLFQSLYFSDQSVLNDNKEYRDKQSAIWFLSFLHFHRVSYTFLSIYNLFLQGYYTESVILLRSVIESFVRLKYVNRNGKLEDVNKILCGFKKTKKEKYEVNYSTMFKDISNDLYFLYSMLCDFSHGGLLSHIPKISKYSKDFSQMATGLEYNEDAAGLVINQFTIYLLNHLELLTQIYPNFKKNMPDIYASKYYDTLAILWKSLGQMSKANGSDRLYNAAQNLIDYS